MYYFCCLPMFCLVKQIDGLTGVRIVLYFPTLITTVIVVKC